VCGCVCVGVCVGGGGEGGEISVGLKGSSEGTVIWNIDLLLHEAWSFGPAAWLVGYGPALTDCTAQSPDVRRLRAAAAGS